MLDKVEMKGTVGHVLTTPMMHGKEVRFSLATQHGIDTKWHDCVAFTESTPSAGELKKGDKVHLLGRIKMERYLRPGGCMVALPKVHVNTLEILRTI